MSLFPITHSLDKILYASLFVVLWIWHWERRITEFLPRMEEERDGGTDGGNLGSLDWVALLFYAVQLVLRFCLLSSGLFCSRCWRLNLSHTHRLHVFLLRHKGGYLQRLFGSFTHQWFLVNLIGASAPRAYHDTYTPIFLRSVVLLCPVHPHAISTMYPSSRVPNAAIQPLGELPPLAMRRRAC